MCESVNIPGVDQQDDLIFIAKDENEEKVILRKMGEETKKNRIKLEPSKCKTLKNDGKFS